MAAPDRLLSDAEAALCTNEEVGAIELLAADDVAAADAAVAAIAIALTIVGAGLVFDTLVAGVADIPHLAIGRLAAEDVTQVLVLVAAVVAADGVGGAGHGFDAATDAADVARCAGDREAALGATGLRYRVAGVAVAGRIGATAAALDARAGLAAAKAFVAVAIGDTPRLAGPATQVASVAAAHRIIAAGHALDALVASAAVIAHLTVLGRSKPSDSGRSWCCRRSQQGRALRCCNPVRYRQLG